MNAFRSKLYYRTCIKYYRTLTINKIYNSSCKKMGVLNQNNKYKEWKSN